MFIAALCVVGAAVAQETTVRGHWPDSLQRAYHPGDDIRYSDPDFDDRDWETLRYTWIEDEKPILDILYM